MERTQKIRRIVIAYPFGLIAIALVVNLLFLRVGAAEIQLPNGTGILVLSIAAAILLINHTWLMTATELTRLRFRMVATPEEWEQSDTNRDEIDPEGVIELERCHNAHRNTTENVVYFMVLAPLLSMISPSTIAIATWTLVFASARFLYTYSYLTGKDGLRGVFMSISLISLYGMACYLLIAIFMSR